MMAVSVEEKTTLRPRRPEVLFDEPCATDFDVAKDGQFLEDAENRTHGPAHNRAAQSMIPGQPVAEAVRQAQYPLPHERPREHPVDETRGELRHAPSATARTETSTVAGKRHQSVEPAPGASEPRETCAECATLQKATKLLLHEARQALSVAEISRLRPKRLEVLAYHLMQNARPIRAAAVGRSSTERPRPAERRTRARQRAPGNRRLFRRSGSRPRKF
jgi:hypothetical protein